ncbi:unnamed protein product [Chrysoparadoxa australica]
MKIWCLYGVGLAAERSYLYDQRESLTEEASLTSVPVTISGDDGDGFGSGVRTSDGDGTAPLLSLGYMCSAGWKDERYPFNPAKIPVKTVEYLHQPSNAGLEMRGGGTSGNHVDIMGNEQLIADILRISSGKGAEVPEHIISKIEDMASFADLLR